jgi:TetR/AcrR family transcriptional repressor of nem operon
MCPLEQAVARPCSYDRQALLGCAMALFWERGFGGTSVDDIVQAAGVSRSSLYAAFPDKNALFLAALEHYLDTVTNAKLEQLSRGERAAPAIRRFLLALAAERPAANAPAHGCLLTNTAVEIGAGHEKVADHVRDAFLRLERVLADRLEQARAQGDLIEGAEPEQLARQLVTFIQGLRVMTRLGVEPRALRDAVQSALAPLRLAEDQSPRRIGT